MGVCFSKKADFVAIHRDTNHQVHRHQMSQAERANIFESLYQAQAANRLNTPQPEKPQIQNSLVNTATAMKCHSSINKASTNLVSNVDQPNILSIEFDILTTYECQLTIYFFAQEIFDVKGVPSYYVDTTKFPPPQYFKIFAGNQTFRNLCFIDTSLYSIDDLFFKNKQIYPIIIEIFPYSQPENNFLQAQTTYYSFSRNKDSLMLKPIRQKFTNNGISYELMEIFGSSPENQHDSRDCIICMSETKDTVIMPCAHVCLCTPCSILMQKEGKDKCPICRSAIKSYMKIENNQIE